MTSIENIKRLKTLRREKILLHGEYKKRADAGDRVGMQRYKKMIREIDQRILAILNGEN